ncbi:glycoside hydrolase [Lojkania enalia]|uniref:xylan 1,4-beta-xylosidase n=1 Tax=Lojkania enalia TaxID=147567 RepID=A0A9P4NCA6_9PLEO|nr:glycoside hydrolase [Didymosphaeria enalia]
MHGSIYKNQCYDNHCISGPLKNKTIYGTRASLRDRASSLVSLLSFSEKINATASTASRVPRLGLPPCEWWSEDLHGIAGLYTDFSDDGDYSYATSLPLPIAIDTLNINCFRGLRWGRGQETPGEDPYHLSSYAHFLIKELQGNSNRHDIEIWNGNFRYQLDAQISKWDLVEYYLPPFQSCARDSNVGIFMYSYNAINGVPTCAEPYLLQAILREYWGWTNEEQWITSDCDAIQNVYLPHQWPSTQEQATADSLNAGTYYPNHLGAAISKNVEGIVLLKNDGLLPLSLNSFSSLELLGGWKNATDDLSIYADVPTYLHSPVWPAQKLNVTTDVKLDLIGRLASLETPMIIAEMGGGYLDSSPGPPDQGGDVAIMGIITGKAVLAGRLPLTQYPASYINEVPMTDTSLRPSTYNPDRICKWYNGSAVYEFGDGLYYTNFSASIARRLGASYEISDLMSIRRDNNLTYLDCYPFRLRNPSISIWTLRSSPYLKKSLIAHTLGSLARVDDKGNKVLYPGNYGLVIDNESLALTNFTLTGREAVIEK